MNCYFEMPFGNGARVTLTNGVQDVPNLCFHIDYQEFSDARGGLNKGRFHAQWRRQVTRAIPESESGGKNVDGKNNYVFIEAKGKGQYVGTILKRVRAFDWMVGRGRRHVFCGWRNRTRNHQRNRK